VKGNQAMAQMSVGTIAVGGWLLTGADADPNVSPVHGVKLVFHNDHNGFHGAMVNWVTGDEVPLAHLHFDGSTLELQMEPDEASRAVKEEIPTLIMTAVANHFEGYWMNASGEKLGGPLAPKLKMVPYRD
jgi:hypothetical protein